MRIIAASASVGKLIARYFTPFVPDTLAGLKVMIIDGQMMPYEIDYGDALILPRLGEHMPALLLRAGFFATSAFRFRNGAAVFRSTAYMRILIRAGRYKVMRH